MSSPDTPVKKPNLFIVIPVFNEADNIDRLLQSIEALSTSVHKEFTLQLILVDDGSQDSTVLNAQSQQISYPLHIINHYKNLGPGAAFANGFAFLSKRLRQHDWVLTMEGDNTSSVETIHHMLLRRREGYDVVLASPYLYSGSLTQVSFFRIVLSQAANALIKQFLGIKGILTFSSFFRLYHGTIIKKLQHTYGPRIIYTTGFEAMVELLAKLVHLKARISEVESTVDWSKRAGKSKMKILKTIIGYCFLFVNWPKLSKTND